MGIFNQLLILLISLTGILFGLILARIAPEELRPGKKYFSFLKRVIFVVIFFFGSYHLLEKLFVLIPFLILMVIIFVIGLYSRNSYLEIINYSLFVVPYFFLTEPTAHLLLASLIFLYGFPTGTLMGKIK